MKLSAIFILSAILVFGNKFVLAQSGWIPVVLPTELTRNPAAKGDAMSTKEKADKQKTTTLWERLFTNPSRRKEAASYSHTAEELEKTADSECDNDKKIDLLIRAAEALLEGAKIEPDEEPKAEFLKHIMEIFFNKIACITPGEDKKVEFLIRIAELSEKAAEEEEEEKERAEFLVLAAAVFEKAAEVETDEKKRVEFLIRAAETDLKLAKMEHGEKKLALLKRIKEIIFRGILFERRPQLGPSEGIEIAIHIADVSKRAALVSMSAVEEAVCIADVSKRQAEIEFTVRGTAELLILAMNLFLIASKVANPIWELKFLTQGVEMFPQVLGSFDAVIRHQPNWNSEFLNPDVVAGIFHDAAKSAERRLRLRVTAQVTGGFGVLTTFESVCDRKLEREFCDAIVDAAVENLRLKAEGIAFFDRSVMMYKLAADMAPDGEKKAEFLRRTAKAFEGAAGVEPDEEKKEGFLSHAAKIWERAAIMYEKAAEIESDGGKKAEFLRRAVEMWILVAKMYGQAAETTPNGREKVRYLRDAAKAFEGAAGVEPDEEKKEGLSHRAKETWERATKLYNIWILGLT